MTNFKHFLICRTLTHSVFRFRNIILVKFQPQVNMFIDYLLIILLNIFSDGTFSDDQFSWDNDLFSNSALFHDSFQ